MHFSFFDVSLIDGSWRPLDGADLPIHFIHSNMLEYEIKTQRMGEKIWGLGEQQKQKLTLNGLTFSFLIWTDACVYVCVEWISSFLREGGKEKFSPEMWKFIDSRQTIGSGSLAKLIAHQRIQMTRRRNNFYIWRATPTPNLYCFSV
jgi:hypothetical protein